MQRKLYSARQLAEAFAVARAIGEMDDDAFYAATYRSGALINLVVQARKLLRAGASRREIEDIIGGQIGIRAAVNRVKAARRRRPREACVVLPFLH